MLMLLHNIHPSTRHTTSGDPAPRFYYDYIIILYINHFIVPRSSSPEYLEQESQNTQRFFRQDNMIKKNVIFDISEYKNLKKGYKY